MPCPERDTPEATIAGLVFDPRVPYGRENYCVNTAIQFYRPEAAPLGHNVRLSEHTWDPQLSSPRFDCICNPASFIGDYFGIDSRGGFTYTASVETFNDGGENPGYHQQQTGLEDPESLAPQCLPVHEIVQRSSADACNLLDSAVRSCVVRGFADRDATRRRRCHLG